MGSITPVATKVHEKLAMVPPTTALHASRWSATLALLLMVRVLGRINSQLEPFVTLRVDADGEPVSARNELVNQAAGLLGVELRVLNKSPCQRVRH